MSATIDFYGDLKSPFTYLAKDAARQLERDYNVRIQFLPFPFPMAEAFGMPEARSPVQMNRVRYAYLDARRMANARSPALTVLAPQKAFDSTLANAACVYAGDTATPAVQAAYIDIVLERFFQRKLDIERIEDVLSALEGAAAKAGGPGIIPRGFALGLVQYIGLPPPAEPVGRSLKGVVRVISGSPADEALAKIAARAEKEGVFGVPSFVVRLPGEEGKGELFFGSDRIEWVARKLEKAGLAKPGANKQQLRSAL